jgi:hypothetical protein
VEHWVWDRSAPGRIKDILGDRLGSASERYRLLHASVQMTRRWWGSEVEIVSRLALNIWRSDSEDRVEVDGDPEVEEQAEQRVTLDDQVLKEGSEFLRLIFASERSPRSQVTG